MSKAHTTKSKEQVDSGNVAVTVFDTDDITSLISPAIATMSQTTEEIGEQTTGVFISLVTMAGAKPGVNLILDFLFQTAIPGKSQPEPF